MRARRDRVVRHIKKVFRNIMGFWKYITFSTSTGCFVTLTEPVLTEPVNHKTQTN